MGTRLGLSNYQQDDWGRGYGREMIVLALRYAFNELNLHRVAHDERFNERALKLYEKLGFRHEGRGREHLLLDGERWDIVYMGMLRGRVRGLRPFRGRASESGELPRVEHVAEHDGARVEPILHRSA